MMLLLSVVSYLTECIVYLTYRQHFAIQCFKNGWTNTLPVLVNLSQDELVPGQVRHEHIHCEATLRTACLAYVLRKEFAEMTDTPADTAQAMVFLDDMGRIETVVAAVEGALQGSGVVAEAGAVGVLDESRSLDSRAKTMCDFRCEHNCILVLTTVALFSSLTFATCAYLG
jgi:hypothetical protein